MPPEKTKTAKVSGVVESHLCAKDAQRWGTHRPYRFSVLLHRYRVDNAIEGRVVAGAPDLSAGAEGLIGAGVHLGICGDIHRPGLPAVAAEVDAAHSGVNIAAGCPAGLCVEKQQLANWPGSVEGAGAPGFAAVGGDVDPAFHIWTDFSAAHPAIVVIGVEKKYRAVEDGIDRGNAGPLAAAVGAGAEVDAGCADDKIRKEAVLQAEPAAGRIVDKCCPLGGKKSAVGGDLIDIAGRTTDQIHNETVVAVGETDSLCASSGGDDDVLGPGLTAVFAPADQAIKAR